MSEVGFHTDEHEWEVLSGCKVCINSRMCLQLGNCITLSIDFVYPFDCTKKRKILNKLKGSIVRPDLYAQEIRLLVSMAIEKQKEPDMVEAEVTVRLTVLEKMFIESLQKPR